jgi:hypothetical protein
MASMNLSSEEEREGFKTQWTKDQMEQYKDDPVSTKYYAVPINHVLAWGYHSEEYTRQRGHRVEQFRFTGPDQQPVVLYFLVANGYFDNVVRVVREHWIGKIDRRPLKDVAFEFLPVLADKYKGLPPQIETVTGRIKMRSYVSFMGAPKLREATLKELAPALAPGFPSCHEWSVDPIAQTMALEREKINASKPIRK